MHIIVFEQTTGVPVAKILITMFQIGLKLSTCRGIMKLTQHVHFQQPYAKEFSFPCSLSLHILSDPEEQLLCRYIYIYIT